MILKLQKHLWGKGFNNVLSHQNIKRIPALKTLFLLIIGSFLTGSVWGQTIYYSQSSSDPTVTTNWNTIRTGGGTSPANFTANNQIFNVQAGHLMTATAALTISGTSSKMIILTGGSVNANGYNHNMTLDMENGATYIVTNTYSNLSFGNLHVNSNFQLNGTSGWSNRVYPNVIQNNSGILTIANCTINGNLIINPGNICNAAASTNPTINILGNITTIGTGSFNGSSGTGIPILNLGGSISGNFTSGIGDGGLILNFTGGATSVNFAPNNLFTTKGHVSINANKTVELGQNISISFGNTLSVNGVINIGTKVISGAGAVTVTNGGTLKIGSLNLSGAIAGNITATGGLILDSGSTVEFNGTAVQTMTSRIFSNLTINNPSGVNLLSNAQVSCNNLTVNPTASFIINSDATNSGSLIINGTATGNITYKRYLTKDKWHLISVPVSNQSIHTFATNPANNITMSGVRYSVSPYDNSGIKGSTAWKYWTSDTTNPITAAGDFISGKGYQILTKTADATVTYSGTTPVSTVNLPISVSTANGTNGWNLIGNPFPASIPANSSAHASNNFITQNISSFDPSYTAIYVWDPVTVAYTVINNGNPAKYLAPGQGFFVKSKLGGSNINFNSNLRTHFASVFHRVAGDETPRISVIAESSLGNKSSTDLNYFDNASLGLDPGYDAGRFGATTSGFGIYTKLVEDNGVDFAVQALPNNYLNATVIPVGLVATAGTTVIFKVNYTNLPEDVKVYFEDQLSGTVNEINSTDKTYTVTLTENSNGIGRFYLRTASPQGTLSVNEVTNTFAKVVPMYNTQQLKVVGKLTYPANIALYDVTGRLILSKSIKSALQNTVSVPNLKKGVYVVKVVSAQQHYSTKIIWTPIN